MCSDNKCLFFIKLRTGSLIFGYASAVLSAIGFLVSIGLIFTAVISVAYSGYAVAFNYVILLALTEMLFAELLTGFISAVVLIKGIKENKPSLVKSNVIYGMIHLILLLIGTIILSFTTKRIFWISGSLGCGIYTLCIYMVYLTYKSMVTETEETFKNQQNLSTA